MINIKEYETWWKKYQWVTPKTDLNSVRAWEACEEFYENKIKEILDKKQEACITDLQASK